MKIFSALLFSLALLVNQTSHADEANPLTEQCQRLAHLDAATIKTLRTYNPPDDIFKDESFDDAYLRALREGSTEAQRSVKSSGKNSSARAGILFAGIVRHDLPMVKAAYSASSADYFTSKSVWSLLTVAASCGFNEGAFFLLDQGSDPNAGHDLGAFNAALAVNDYDLARGLLKAGYNIANNEKRCRSSGYILHRNEAPVPADLKASIRASSCATDASASH